MSPKDFEQLCQSIEHSISKIMDTVGKGIDKAEDVATVAINQAIENQKARQQSARQTQNQSQINLPTYANREIYRQKNSMIRSRFKSSAGLTASGIALTAIGATLAATFIAAEMIGLLTMGVIGVGNIMGALGVVGIFAGLSIWALVVGIKRITLGGKLKSFKRIFGDREVCSIKELSERAQLNPAKTLATARKLIKKGYLPQGRLDSESTCLMVTNDSYNLYLQAKSAYEQRMMEERAAQNAKKRVNISSSSAQTSSEADAFVHKGANFIQEMKGLDAAIDDVELSEKIVQIEAIIDRILDRVRNDPSLLNSVSGLDRLNDYYLPQTIKLLAAYEELEEQPIQGETIINSRKEIENTLNVLGKAYDKLLDSTFEDLSMDVSSDISVLHAMLAREGLTESPFDEKPFDEGDKL